MEDGGWRKEEGTRPLNFWRELAAIGESMPPEERAKLPRDGASNLDHYLHEALKREGHT